MSNRGGRNDAPRGIVRVMRGCRRDRDRGVGVHESQSTRGGSAERH